ERLGGLCRTFRKGEFAYDIGGHILFSRSPAVLDIIRAVLGKNAGQRRRNNKILFKGRHVKYPFENGLGDLDRWDIYECLIGYLMNNHPKPSNFKEWILHNFGDGIASKYLLPYNEKIWKVPLERIDIDWVERVPKPPLDDIIKSALGIETEGYLHQLNFYYPTTGGIESLVRAFVGDSSKIATGFEVTRIRRSGNGWVVSDAENERYFERIVLTMPIHEAVKCFDDVPAKVLDAVQSLMYNSVRIVLICVDNQSLLDKSAVYIPDPRILPHRVCFMGYFSETMVPDGKSSLIAEITTRRGLEYYGMSDSALTERVAKDLENIGLIDVNKIVTAAVTNVEYGYVIHDLDRRKNIALIRSYFSSKGIELHGRFAEFEYINMDEVIRRSMTLAERLDASARR
ncbi:MAG TPA: FAD-dependent oxidoreductase, partial [Candidatus Acidoferrum sp.]|nr:FAD-dependent oxidoreductase [Candidatus Acidoferrum sp.]